MDKCLLNPVKHLTRVRVFSLVMIFFNGMSMSDYESKS